MFIYIYIQSVAFPMWASVVAQSVKNPPTMQVDLGLIPGLGIYSNILAWRSLDSGAWRTIVHAVTKSWTQLSNLHFSFLQYVIFIQISAHQKKKSFFNWEALFIFLP